MNPDLFLTVDGIATVRKSQEERFESTIIVDWIVDLMEQRKKYRHIYEKDKATVNQLKKSIGPLMKNKVAATKSNQPFDSSEVDNLLLQKDKGINMLDEIFNNSDKKYKIKTNNIQVL